jgi:hypothetical protein
MLTRLTAASLVLASSVACSQTSPNGVGSASIKGQVFQAPNIPLTNSQIVVSCANGAIIKTDSIDANGNFLVNLSAAPSVLTGTQGDIVCRFGAPDSLTGRLQASATVHFYLSGLPHPIQTVNLGS